MSVKSWFFQYREEYIKPQTVIDFTGQSGHSAFIYCQYCWRWMSARRKGGPGKGKGSSLKVSKLTTDLCHWFQAVVTSPDRLSRCIQFELDWLLMAFTVIKNRLYRSELVKFSYLPPEPPPRSSGSVLDHRSLPPVFATRRWHVRKVISSFTSSHYLWRSLGPISLPCAQKWP